MSEQTTQTNTAPAQAAAPKKDFSKSSPRPMGSRAPGSRPFTPRPRPMGPDGKPVPGGERRRIVRGGTKPGDNKNPRDSRAPRTERPRSEYEQKMIDLRRVTRVVSGGRRMSFAVALVIGDKKGKVGLGTGKGADTAIAIAKALKQAKKNLITLKLTKNMSLPHDVQAKYNASRVTINPNKAKGMVAGSSIRDILTLAGVQNVTAKIHSGSKNKLVNARAAIKALEQVATKTPVFSANTSDAYSAN